MEQSEQACTRQPQLSDAVGYEAGPTQMGIPPYQIPATASGAPATAISSPTRPADRFPNTAHQLAHQQPSISTINSTSNSRCSGLTKCKRSNKLPTSRIKKIMKSDEDVRMISAEVPLIFAKAREMFILELTFRTWIHTELNKRRMLQKNDIAAAISRTDVFDFLVDIIPRDDLREEELGVTKASIPFMGSPADMPYYAIPAQQAVGMMICAPVDLAGTYVAQQQQAQLPPRPYMPWLHLQMPHQRDEQQSDS